MKSLFLGLIVYSHIGSAGNNDRNQLMVDVATHAVFIRAKGKSNGTDDCIKRAKKKGIPIYIHHV